ncbi:MAG: 30S ribosomal protein S6 [Candidatus Latescibacteria bacterium]|nr:30S ribosomal protein S6 [Candidatus Latescibacterota bacterium]
MQHYEGTFVLDPTLQEEGYNKQLERIKKFIDDRGGRVIEDDRWGLRTLAYEIKKQTQGFYGVLEWEGPGGLIGELDHMLRLDEHILRHLIVHIDSTILTAREELRQRKVARTEAEDRDKRSVMDEDVDEHENEFDEEQESTGSPEQDDEGREE